jgi:hypothetical protein
MIASVEKGFVLLSNPKCGTTSIEAAFDRFADIRVGNSPKWKHINYDRMTEVFGDYFQRRGCTIYAVARDPVDSLVSWYRYRSRTDLARRRPERYTGDIPFSQFAEEWQAGSTKRARVPVSVNWCLTRDGSPAPITFYRYEDLPQLLDVLCRHLGQRVTLERRNVSPDRPIDLDRAAVAALPKMRRFIEIYDSIPFAGHDQAESRAKVARSAS